MLLFLTAFISLVKYHYDPVGDPVGIWQHNPLPQDRENASDLLPTWMSNYIDNSKRNDDYAPLYYMFPQPEKYYENLKSWLSPPMTTLERDKI